MFTNIKKSLFGENNTGPTVLQWIAGFTAIVIIRSFLQVVSSSQNSVNILENSSRVNYWLCFALIAFSLALIISLFTKQRNNSSINIVLYASPILFLPPIIDLILKKGAGGHSGYLFDSGAQLLVDFLTLGGTERGFSVGMQVGAAVIVALVGTYVWGETKKIWRVTGAMLLSYLMLFIIGALPGIIYTISEIPQDGPREQYAYNFIERSIMSSNIPTNVLSEALAYPSHTAVFNFGFRFFLSQTFYILLFIVGLVWFWYTHQNVARAVFKNTRIPRIILCVALLGLGALYAYTKSPVLFTWVDWVSVTALLISWFSACMYVTQINDLADIDIDKITNTERPLVKKTITEYAMRETSTVWLSLALVGAYAVGYFSFFMIIIFLSVYYLYSAPPLRLKRVPFFSSFIISIAVLSVLLSGFFFTMQDKSTTEFPLIFSLGIVVIFTLWANFRDIKDVKGDRAVGIQTIPVLFGKYGKHIVGGLHAVSYLLFPFFFSTLTTYTIAITTALIGYWLCVREPYKESSIFFLFFAFCVASILLK